MNEIITKIQAVYSDLHKACGNLEEALAQEPTRLYKDATIKRFELAFELSWKFLQLVTTELGKTEVSPRSVIRTAALLELIEDPVVWFSFLDARNMSVHVYKEQLADKVYEVAKKMPGMIHALLESSEVRNLHL